MTRWFKRWHRNKRLALLALAVLGLSIAGAFLLYDSPEKQAQKYYQRGLKLVEQRDYAKASIELRNAVRLKNDLLPAWRSLAQIEETTRNWQRLIASLRSINDLDPSDIEVRIKLAKLLVFTGSARPALTLTDAGIDADRPNAKLLGLRAGILYQLNDTVKAIKQARDALSVDPSNPDALIVLAADRVAKNDEQAALRILESDPTSNDLGIQLFRLRLYEQIGDLPQVESLLRTLTALHPEDSGFRRQLIKFYVDQHRQDNAEGELRKVIQASPANSEAELDLVRLLYAAKGPAAAKQELVARISAGGEVFPYQIALAEFSFSQGDFAESERLLQNLASHASSSEQAFAAQVKLAEMDIKRKKIDAAAALVSEILQKDARNTNGLRLRASIYMARGQLASAITDLRQALNEQPQSTDLTLLLASAYERSGSIAEADKLYAAAVKMSEFDATVGLNYVSFLERRGRGDSAKAIMAELRRRWPKNVDILSAFAEDKLTRHDWSGAKEIAEAIRSAGDTRGVASQVLGAALFGQQKYDESIAVFQSAVEASPSAVQPTVSLVRSLMRAQKPDQAMAFLKSALQSNPENVEARVLMGSIQFDSGALDEALKSFKLAIEKQPKNVAGYQALANLWIEQKKFDQALDVIRSGLQVVPDSMILHLALAGTLEKTRQYEAAITEYEYMLGQQPGFMIVENNLASLLTDHRSDKASLERARSLMEGLRESPVPQFEDTIGWISYRQGKYVEAVSLLEHAAAELPNSALVHYHLGMCYIAITRTAEASKQLKAAQSLAPDSELDEKIQDALKKLPT
jgi:tetratricopeptide (TPR) repeat protein